MGAVREPNVILYDGVCGVCNRFNRLVIDHDPQRRFAFAPLQGELARRLLAPHGRDPADLDTLFVIVREDGPERVLERSDASAFVLSRLSGPLRLLGAMRILPRGLRDLGYDLFARNRYRLMGRSESCPMPRTSDLERFLET